MKGGYRHLAVKLYRKLAGVSLDFIYFYGMAFNHIAGRVG